SPGDSAAVRIIGPKDGLFSKNISSILEDSKNDLWFGTDIGITKYLRRENRFEKVFNNLLPSEEIRALFRDHQGNIWVGTRDSGLVEIQITSGNVLVKKHAWDERLPGNQVTSICEDADHSLWVGTSSGGAAELTFDAKG